MAKDCLAVYIVGTSAHHDEQEGLRRHKSHSPVISGSLHTAKSQPTRLAFFMARSLRSRALAQPNSAASSATDLRE
jgi:hypothetical protein